MINPPCEVLLSPFGVSRMRAPRLSTNQKLVHSREFPTPSTKGLQSKGHLVLCTSVRKVVPFPSSPSPPFNRIQYRVSGQGTASFSNSTRYFHIQCKVLYVRISWAWCSTNISMLFTSVHQNSRRSFMPFI